MTQEREQSGSDEVGSGLVPCDEQQRDGYDKFVAREAIPAVFRFDQRGEQVVAWASAPLPDEIVQQFSQYDCRAVGFDNRLRDAHWQRI